VRTNYAAMARAGLLGRWATVSTVTDGASRLPAEIAAEIVALLA
jgi:dTMP kinase